MIIYTRRNPIVILRLLLTDFLCLLTSFIFHPKPIKRFNKILIANPSHLGDLVISSFLVDILKSNYPKLEIDFLCGSWGKDLLGANQNISNIFVIDLQNYP